MFKVIKKEEYKVSTWSGGTTTEICLAPEDGSYKDRRFDFRISSATVDLEESDFTLLEGVKRYLTILEGEMELTFSSDVVSKVDLKPYEVVEFMGDVPTHSVGKAKDFNLMLKGCEGKMETIVGKEFFLEIPKGTQTFIYSASDWKTEIASEEQFIIGGDTLHIIADETMEVKGNGQGNWIVIMVSA